MTEVSDEMLMAFADGELEPAAAADLGRAVAADPALQRRVEVFRATRRLAAASLAAELAEPVPEHLVATVMKGSRQLRRGRQFLPLAAALVLAAGIGSYFGAMPRTNLLAPSAALNAALEGALSGESISRAGENVVITGTFATPQGPCRSFRAGGAEGSAAGLGCRRNGAWRIEAMGPAAGEGEYRPAAGGAAIDAALDALGAGDAMPAEAERAARDGGWE